MALGRTFPDESQHLCRRVFSSRNICDKEKDDGLWKLVSAVHTQNPQAPSHPPTPTLLWFWMFYRKESREFFKKCLCNKNYQTPKIKPHIHIILYIYIYICLYFIHLDSSLFSLNLYHQKPFQFCFTDGKKQHRNIYQEIISPF
jgi:hypothetical protein